MKIYNVIEKSYNEIWVYSYDDREKAEKKVKELKERLLRQEWLDEKSFIKKQQLEWGEDAIVWEDDNVDVYWSDYEVFIESTSLL